MKLIFLDIDGVLNSDLWYKSQEYKKSEKELKHLDPKSIQFLNRIIEATKAKIIITSTWRLDYSLEEIKRRMSLRGFKGDLLDSTPDLVTNNKSFVRGNEIYEWCKNNEKILEAPYYEYRDYVIIDDRDDMLYWQKDNFVEIDRYCGITPTKTSEIIKNLSNNN